MPTYFTGCVHLDKLEPAAALPAAQRAYEIFPRFNWHMMIIGHAYLLLGNDVATYREACRTFRARESYDFSWGLLASDLVSRVELGRAAIVLGAADEAREHLEPVAEVHPEARALLAQL
jgi:hypothetical protein